MSARRRAPSAKKTAETKSELTALLKELQRAKSLESQLMQEISELRKRVTEGETARSTVAELSRELNRRTRRMEQELIVARQFQRLFVPPTVPDFPQVHFAVKHSSSPRVGGDIYDVFDMGNSCVGIFIGDSSGNGLAATLVAAVAKIALDTFRQNEYSPRVIMEKVNRQVIRNTLENQFLTCFMGVLDLATLRMKYVNASHPCPVVYGPERFELLDTEGMCCGMFEEPNYGEKEISLRVGDKMLFYTRGLVESCNDCGQSFEHRMLYDLLRANITVDANSIVDIVTEQFVTHLHGAEQMEDLTLIAAQLLPRAAKEERIVIPSEPMQINRVENLILNRLEALNYGERTIFGVRLAIEEAVINAIKHGNRMDKAKKVTITYTADNNECVVTVADEGEGFDPNAVPDPTEDENLELPHGRGLVLIKAYMDHVSYNKKGTAITMRKKAPWRE